MTKPSLPNGAQVGSLARLILIAQELGDAASLLAAASLMVLLQVRQGGSGRDSTYSRAVTVG